MLSAALGIESANKTSSLLSGTYVISQSRTPEKTLPVFHPVTSILSSLPRPDLTVLSVNSNSTQHPFRTLPVSPYPVHPGTTVRAHFVVDTKPDVEGWYPWVGGLWGKWVRGTVLGYRDFAGREAKASSNGIRSSEQHLLQSI